MITITNEQVEFILNDFESRGIVTEGLRDDLLDHMCCVIESEMQESDDFHRFYERVLPRFFKDSLGELQTETDNLLRFKNFYSMKRTLKITGILTVFFTIIGAVFKTLHLPGAGVTIILGGALFSFVFMPLLIILKFKDDESKVDKWVFSFGLLLGIGLAVGLVLKLMHWPGAFKVLLTSTVLFTFVYVPIYFATRIKRPELKFNTIVNSVLMMACGGLFFALFNLGSSRTLEEHLVENHKILHENAKMLFESNSRLMETEEKEGAEDLHGKTVEVNEQIERMAAVLVKEKNHRTTGKINKDLKSSVKEYNSYIKGLDSAQLIGVNGSVLNDIRSFNVETSMNILARMQQELAVNENCYLTSE
jgi:hypothetical protein